MRSPSCSGGRGAVSARPIARPSRRRSGSRCLRPAPARSRRARCLRRWISSTSAEPVQPAGEPRDLAVMAERGIDEAGGPDERAHAPLIAPTRCCCRKRVDRLQLARPARRARRSSRCTTARPAARRRPCGSTRHAPSQAIEPSARTLAVQRRLASVSIDPGGTMPAFDQQAEGDARLPCACRPSPSSRSRRAAASRRSARARPSHSCARARSRSSCRPSRRATAPVVPVPKNGSSTTSPGLVQASRIR